MHESDISLLIQCFKNPFIITTLNEQKFGIKKCCYVFRDTVVIIKMVGNYQKKKSSKKKALSAPNTQTTLSLH